MTRHLRACLPVVLAGLVVAGFFLLLYPVKRYSMPIGWDTPRYLDQTVFVAERGLSGVPRALPPPGKTLASRAGYPVVVLSLSGLFGTSTTKVAAVIPVAAAVALALAGAAFLSFALRRRSWEMAAAVVIVGVSPVVMRLMAPETYTDNLFAMALFAAALVPAVAAAGGGEGLLGAALLVGMAGVAHEAFFVLVLAVLGLVVLVYLPRSLRAWRQEGTRLLCTPSGAMGAAMAGGAAVAAAGIFGFLRRSPDIPKLSRGELNRKFHEDIPLYVFPLTVPVAAAGAGWLARVPRRGRGGQGPPDPGRFEARFVLTVLGAWTAVVAVGLAAYLFGRLVPAHRFLAFLLPLPLFVAVAVLWLGRTLAARVARWAGVAAVAASVVALGVVGYRDLYVTLADHRGVEWMEIHKMQDAATAAAYLDATGVSRSAPVVFVVNDTGLNPLSYVPEMAYMIRSVLPADRIEHAWFYVGDPGNYLAGVPTLQDRPKTYNVNSLRFWRPLEPIRASDPVALLLASYNPTYGSFAAAHPERVVAPGVVALNGPRPPSPLGYAPIPSGPRTIVQGVLLGGGVPAVLALIGLGWAAALLPRRLRSFEIIALAPAVGIGALIAGGIIVDALGVRLGGLGGALTIVGTAAAGWAAGVIRWRRSRRDAAQPAAFLPA